MAVDFGKLNKPGLHASFGSQKSRTGVSAQATKNLGNTTTASKSSIFSLNSRHSSNWVSGSRNNVDITKHNYQNMRANLNSRGFIPQQENNGWGSFGIGSSGMGMGVGMGMMNGMTNINYNPNNSQVAGTVVGQVLNGTFGLLNNLGVLDGLKSSVSSAVGDLSSATQSLGGNSSVSSGIGSEAKASISNMKSAQDSSTLRKAISSAKSALKGLETKAAGLDNAKSARDTAKSELTEAKDNKKTCESKLTQATQKRDGIQAKLTSAKAVLKTIPEEIDDGNGGKIKNTAHEQQKQVVEDLEKQLEAAKTEVENADKADKEAEAKVKTAETDLETKEKELDDCEVAEKDAKSLESEISKQESRLTKLEEKEAKEAGELDTKIGENTDKMAALSDKINPNDGMDRGERRAAGKIDKLDRKNTEARQRRDTLNGYGKESDEIKQKLGDRTHDFTVGSDNYEKVDTSAGNTFYYKNGQMISEEEYNAAKPAS